MMPDTARLVPSFRVALAQGDHWGLAAKTCAGRLAPMDANVGFLYVTEGFNQNLSSILTFLRETTRIPHWVGAVAPAILAGGTVVAEKGALAVMVGTLAEDSFRLFWGVDASEITTPLSSWLAARQPVLALAHGDPRSPGLAGLVAALATQEIFTVGGLVSSSGPRPLLSDTVAAGGLAGLLLGSEVEAISGLTQGCAPIGPLHRVTSAGEGVVMELDGRPALDVLKEEAGQLIARDLRRAAGYIHLALPVAGADDGGYVVRMLLGIDPRRGWLAMGDTVDEGGTVRFVRRDPQTARDDLERMLDSVVRRLAGRPIRCAFYHSCVGRGRHMFGHDEAELEMVRAALGDDVPLIGFFGHGEFAGERLYAYTGVLTVLVGETP